MAKFTRDTAAAMGRRGGQATAQKYGREHMGKIGRRGFHALVRLHYADDYRRAINTLIARGLMALDPVPTNGAWTTARVPNRLPADYQPPAEDAHPGA